MSSGLRHTIVFLPLLFTWIGNSFAQLNLNMHNGMPSNHVYQMVKDRYGYLWIATTNGLVRYNGYDLKTYTIADGLPSDDIWSIHLDRKDRLWLLCFANAPGYIFRNKYRETYVNNDDYTLSTERITEHKDGIAFLTKFRDSIGASLFREQNDTLVNVCNSLRFWYFHLNHKGEIFYAPINSEYIIYRSKLDDPLKLKRHCRFDSSVTSRHWQAYTRFPFYNYDITYKPGKNTLYGMNFTNCQVDTIFLPAAISKVVHLDKHLCIFAGDNAYTLDSNLKLLRSVSMANIGNGFVSSPDEIVYLVEDKLWGKTIATQSNGLFVLPWKMPLFRKLVSFKNTRYKYVGSVDDNAAYWWNSGDGSLARVDENGAITYRTIDTREILRKILPFDSTHSLLFFNNVPSFFNHKTGTFRDLQSYSLHFGQATVRQMAADGVMVKDTLYSVNSAGLYKNYIINDTLYYRPIYMDRCIGVLSDSLRKMIWAYNTGKIILYNSADKIFVVSNKLIRNLGINRIEQILLDNQHGNIFIKDGDKLLCFNPENHTCQQLFNQCNLSRSKIFLRGNTLVVAGRFGVLFSKVIGRGKVSEPVIHFNDKYYYYLNVYDAHVSKSKLLLHTDNGLYAVDIPQQEEYPQKPVSHPYNLLLSYADDLRKITDNDSISINQDNHKLLLDLIKPLGSGHPKYQYFITGFDSSWHQLNNNELTLPILQPGRYHTLLLKVRDDVWKSTPVRLHLYVIPYWWETNPGQTIAWLLGLMFAIGVILSTVLITRRIITKNNLKKNKLLELEIKSIHSQINPHFIFNTLNTTLHYIVKKKLDEAYDHVSSFSSLLRAYLKSSRNRYITLGEEINNLQNYIRLQQTRFENTFTYEIITDVPAGKTIFIPSLLLQPIVENAINHGLLPKDASGHLKLTFTADIASNVLQCVIDDNGVGRKKHIEDKPKDPSQRESYGSQLINELVDVLNKYENAGIKINYIDKELPNTGTTVIITIKNALKNG